MTQTYDEFKRAMNELIEKKGKGADPDRQVFDSRIEPIKEAINKGVPILHVWGALREHAGFQGPRAKLSKFLAEAGLRQPSVRKRAAK